MSFSTFTHEYPKKSKELIFIDVDPKPPATLVKEECAPSSLLVEKCSRPRVKRVSERERGAEKLQCSECSLSTSSAERMMRHMRRHRGENPFQCSSCDYSTYNSTLFEEHVNIHNGVKPYQCTQCEYRSVSKKYMKKHESRHGTCDKCGFVARDIRLLRRHKRQAGCVDDKALGKFTCEKCNIFYNTPECLKQHVKLHKVCPECGEGFSTLVLQKHRKKVHGVSKEVAPKRCKFKCALCEWKSNCHQKILLHLIHHPAQEVDNCIDVTPLVKAGILMAGACLMKRL